MQNKKEAMIKRQHEDVLHAGSGETGKILFYAMKIIINIDQIAESQ